MYTCTYLRISRYTLNKFRAVLRFEVFRSPGMINTEKGFRAVRDRKKERRNLLTGREKYPGSHSVWEI